MHAGDSSGEDDLVIGYVSEKSGDAYAYPIKMLNLHEIVNDVIDGEPILISYCPLCASGVVFDRRMGSVWAVTGEGVSGPLQGRQLRPLPSRIAQWFSIVRTIPDIEVYTP